MAYFHASTVTLTRYSGSGGSGFVVRMPGTTNCSKTSRLSGQISADRKAILALMLTIPVIIHSRLERQAKSQQIAEQSLLSCLQCLLQLSRLHRMYHFQHTDIVFRQSRLFSSHFYLLQINGSNE